MNLPHGDHYHYSIADYEDCLRRKRWDLVFDMIFLATIALVLITASCLYALYVYGDWTCGLPSVECRKVIP